MASRQAASKAIQLTKEVKPLLSLDAAEARHRVLSLYKAWYRQIPWMMREYNLPVTADIARKTLRQRFEENKHVKDIRVIDMLVVKGQNDLKEVVEIWSQPHHIMSKFFREEIIERPKDFMSKFLAGND